MTEIKTGKDLLICLVLAGGCFYLASRCNEKDLGKEIYRGNIDGKEITYHEKNHGLFSPGQNRLSVKQRDTTYILFDRYNETTLEEPSFNQKLEKIIIETENQKEELYYPEHIFWSNYRSTSLEEQNTISRFRKLDTLYNDLRKKIKTELEKK